MNTGQSQALWRRKPAKLLVYTRDGTVFRRFYRWLNEQKGLRERWWDLRAATQYTLAYKLETGAKLSLYSDDQLSKAIFVQHFEADERDFICRYLAAGDIFVDVGANIGLFTLIGAGMVGPCDPEPLEECSVFSSRLVRSRRRANAYHLYGGISRLEFAGASLCGHTVCPREDSLLQVGYLCHRT